MPGCIFCLIITRQSPATILYEDDDVIVFRNVLRWLPLMLLTVPKRHRLQEELWSDLGHAGRVAAEMGQRYCPNGFRLVSNFGWDALQSQPHAHIHVLGGGAMEALTGRTGPTAPVLETDRFTITLRRTGWPPVVMVAEPRDGAGQHDLWADEELVAAIGRELVTLGKQHCPYGFRFAADFGWDALQALPGGHIYLLGGAELGHYV